MTDFSIKLQKMAQGDIPNKMRLAIFDFLQRIVQHQFKCSFSLSSFEISFSMNGILPKGHQIDSPLRQAH